MSRYAPYSVGWRSPSPRMRKNSSGQTSKRLAAGTAQGERPSHRRYATKEQRVGWCRRAATGTQGTGCNGRVSIVGAKDGVETQAGADRLSTTRFDPGRSRGRRTSPLQTAKNRQGYKRCRREARLGNRWSRPRGLSGCSSLNGSTAQAHTTQFFGSEIQKIPKELVLAPTGETPAQ
jgi:hypothetical protein